MRKLILVCECGERMQVPRSALGKTGLCPSCGRGIPIRADNTMASNANVSFGSMGRSAETTTKPFRSGPSDEDKRRFGEAVDLYFAKRYAEALAIFDTLRERYPNNEEIETGRTLCMKAIQTRPVLALEHQRQNLNGQTLNLETVQTYILDLMINGSTDEIRLHAAELACRILKLDRSDHESDDAEDTIERLRDALNASEEDAPEHGSDT